MIDDDKRRKFSTIHLNWADQIDCKHTFDWLTALFCHRIIVCIQDDCHNDY